MRASWLVGMLAGSLLCSEAALAAPVKPLVAHGQGSVAPGLELVKKKKKEKEKEESDEGERDWMEYLKMSFTFNDEEVSEVVADGRIVEHLLGGFLAAFGGHIWAPTLMAYKDVEQPSAAMWIGVISTVHAWMFLPLLLWWAIPYIGWFTGWLPFMLWAGVNIALQFWFLPRALQFAYSDASGGPGAGGGSGDGDAPKKKAKKKPPKKKHDDDDD